MALTRTITAALAISGGCVHAFSTGKISSSRARTQTSLFSTTENTAAAVGSIHGENSCFLPLLQNDDEYIAPRIVQVRLLLLYHHSSFFTLDVCVFF